MTAKITSQSATFYINNPQTTIGGNNYYFQLKGQYSQDILIDTNDWSVNTENSRYLSFTVNLPTDFKDKHYNGFYTWSLGPFTDIVKIITQPGGDVGKEEYISNNENRDAEVFYRPNY